VVPFRGAEIAGKICEVQIDQAKQSGAKSINLHVRKDNVPAVKGYYRLGFKPKEGTEQTYENSGQTFIDMEIEL
ncbi:MAG: GNAT family N-acetyltransferase, partial [Candidatus Saganbacteria bacterium]|nr:GNAT family N-acetyltransferase [Candidatus Saganbacteria bacterium]